MSGGNGFNAPTRAISSTGEEVKGLVSDVNRIKQDSSNAEVSDSAWGLIGLFVKDEYTQLLDAFSRHLDQLGQGIDKAGQTFHDVAEDYEQTDRDHQQTLQKVMDELGGGGA